jgi:catalase
MGEAQKQRLVHNLIEHMKLARKELQERQTGHFLRADPDYGKRVADGLGLRVPVSGELITA